MRILIIGLALALAACRVERPEHIAPVSAFQSERYLGTWYEIARIDNRFEKGLSRVSAEYKANPDGGMVEMEGKIHVSNVVLHDAKKEKAKAKKAPAKKAPAKKAPAKKAAAKKAAAKPVITDLAADD